LLLFGTKAMEELMRVKSMELSLKSLKSLKKSCLTIGQHCLINNPM
jgi:hypothetical protein